MAFDVIVGSAGTARMISTRGRGGRNSSSSNPMQMLRRQSNEKTLIQTNCRVIYKVVYSRIHKLEGHGLSKYSEKVP